MRKIRIGNDIAVQWSLVAKGTGEPFALEDKSVRLFLKSLFSVVELQDFTIVGNTIGWRYKGSEQKQTGVYTLVVSVEDAQEIMTTTDACDFIELVGCTCEIGGNDPVGITTESIELTSVVEVGAVPVDLSEYLTKKEAARTYQQKEAGKGLSTNDYTNEDKNKLASLQNYDDTEIRQELTELSQEKEDKTNKVTSLTEESTDEQYPSAKAVYALSERISENDVLIADLQDMKIDKEADDYYPQLAVGLADNLSGVDVVDSEVNFRRSGGGAISDGVARIEAIKGNSVVWNQCFGNGATTKDYLKWEDNVATINGEFDADNQSFDTTGYGARFVVPIVGHKYLVEIDVISGTISGRLQNYLFCADKTINITESKLSVKEFITATTGGYWIARTMIANTIATNLKVRHRITDLTQMFGAGNEPTTIEDFYQRIPQGIDLNAYNEGEVIHCDVQSIESVGVNAWDEEWEVGNIDVNNGLPLSQSYIRSKYDSPIKVLPNTEYYIYNGTAIGQTNVNYNAVVFFYDKDDIFIKRTSSIANTTFTTPQNCEYARFYLNKEYGATYKNDICINLSDTSINGKYFPYVKRTEDLSIIRKYFPQGMKKAGTAHDEIRYNKQSNKWEYSKGRFRSVDLGTCDWTQDESDATRFKTLAITWKATYTNNLLCEKYATAPTQDISLPDKSIAMTNSQTAPLFRVKDSAYTDAASFKAAMQGILLYYESNDWEWVELDAEDQFKDLDYQVWNLGTEKAIAEGKSAPLAADITYGFNAIGKIKELESLVAALRAKVGI